MRVHLYTHLRIYHLEGFVSEITVFPDLMTVFALPEIVKTFTEILQSNASTPVSLVYDTTFNLGDFYVSPLVFRHVLFEGNPWIPLAFLIHDRKLQKCHNRLFEVLADKMPLLKSKKIAFITDREPALTKAVLKHFPRMQVLHCWNHLKRDFKEELRKLGAVQSEVSVYLSDWRQMAQSETLEDFNSTYEKLTSKWSANVKAYFDKRLKEDLMTYSGRWVIEEIPGLYDPFSGITNNPSESINAVLKRMTGWQELPVDCMMLSLYHIQNYYNLEIQRGHAGLGNYQLKTKYKEAKIDKDEIIIPNKVVEPGEIITYEKSVISDAVRPKKLNKKQNVIDNTDLSSRSPPAETKDDTDTSPCSPPAETISPVENHNLPSCSLKFKDMIDSESDNEESPQKIRDNNISQKSLAKFVLDNNGVMHVPECEAYIVKGHNEKKYCVTLHPETCQCPSMSRCYHILAVRMFVGLPIDDCHSEVSLRSLSKRSLKRSDKKSGRKRPRKNDVDISVTPAPDSLHEEMKKTPKSEK